MDEFSKIFCQNISFHKQKYIIYIRAFPLAHDPYLDSDLNDDFVVGIRVIYTVFDEFITENLPRLTAVDHDEDDYVG